MDNNKPPSLAQYLPFGELLRVFLDQKSITVAALRSILRARGVYLPSYDKQFSVPHLAFTALTPSEFHFLLDIKKTKEESPKTVHKVVAWESNRTIAQSLDDFGVLENLVGAHQTFKVNSVTPPEIVGGDEDCVKIAVSVEKNDLHKNWVEDTGAHSGYIELKKINAGGEVKLSVTTTIPETKEVCKKIAKGVTKHLKASGDISRDESYATTYDAFDNSSRVKFLLSLTDTNNLQVNFNSITNAEIALDTTSKLPKDIQILLKKVNAMTVRGDELQDSPLLADSTYHQYILLNQILVKYDFDYHGGKGSVAVSYSFSKSSKDGKGEFVTNVYPFVLEDSKDKDRKAIREFLQSFFDDFSFRKSREAVTEMDAKKVPKIEKELAADVKASLTATEYRN